MTRDTYSIYAYNGLGVGRLRWGKTLSQKRGNPTKTTWKSHHFLQLDNNKTEILVIAAELLWPENTLPFSPESTAHATTAASDLIYPSDVIDMTSAFII